MTMDTLQIELDQGKTHYLPGEEIAGTVQWRFDERAEQVELRLFWHTRGKGDEDAGLVDSVTFESPSMYETRQFRFTLPGGPYSFSGKLISLIWALELVAEPGERCERVELTVSPTGREIVLGTG